MPVPDIIRKKWVINLSSKPLSDGETISSTEGPQICCEFFQGALSLEYITVTKRICDELSENTAGKDCTEIYQKTKEVLQHFKDKKGAHLQHHQTGEGRPSKTLREDSS